MNITPQQILRIMDRAGTQEVHLTCDIALQMPVSLALSREKLAAAGTTRASLRESLAQALADNALNYLQQLGEEDLLGLLGDVELTEIANAGDRRLLTAAQIEEHAVALCEAHGVRLVEAQEEEIKGRWDWLDDQGNACDASQETRLEAALDAIETLGLGVAQSA